MTRSTTAIFRANGSAFINEMRKMSSSTDRLNQTVTRNFAQMSGRIRQFTRLAGTLFAGFSAVQFTQEVGRAVESSTRIGNTLRAAGINVDEFRDKLLSTAIEARAPIEGLANSLLRLQKIRPQDGADLNLERVATLNRLAIAGGKSGAEASSVSLQTLQSIQSGFLQGDELRSLREAAPVELLQAIADQAGITIGELKEAGAQGRLTSDLVLAAIDSQSQFSRQAISELALTFSQATTNVGSAFTTLAGTVDQELGASSNAANVLDGFAGLLQAGTENSDLLAQSIVALGRGIGVLVGARGFSGVTNAIKAANAAAEQNVVVTGKQAAATRLQVTAARDRLNASRLALAAATREGASQTKLNALTTARAKASTSLANALTAERAASQGLSAAQKRLAFTARAASVAKRGLNSVMGFFGGPIGLTLTLGTAFLTLAGNIETAADRLNGLADSSQELSNVRSRIAELSDAVGDDVSELAKAEDALTQALLAQPEAASGAARAYRDSVRERLSDNRQLLEIETSNLRRQIEANQRNLNRSIAEAAIAGGAQFGPDAYVGRSNQPNPQAIAQSPEELALAVQFLETRRQTLIAEEGLSAAQQAQLDTIEKILTAQAAQNETAEYYRTLVAEQAAAQDVVSSHVLRNLGVIREQVASTDLLANLNERLAEQEARKAQLLAERAELEARIAAAQDSGQVDLANQLANELERVNSAYEAMNPIIAGSNAELDTMLVLAQATAAELRNAEFDPDGTLYANAVAVVDALQAAIDAGVDLNTVDFAALQGQLNGVVNAADAAALALFKARGQAAQLALENSRRIDAFDPRGDQFNSAEARAARVASNFEDFQNQRNVYVPDRPTPTSTRGSGAGRPSGGTRAASSRAAQDELSEEAQLLKDVEALTTRVTTSSEQRLTPMQQAIRLREKLLATYPEEAEAIEDLNGAISELEQQARIALSESIVDDLFRAIDAGESFDSVLKKIGLSLLQLAANNALSNINAGLSAFGQPKASGGGILGGLLSTGGKGLLGSIGGLFGFAEGGVMSSAGKVPLRKYADGGVARSPQLALFGEGDGPEAFVPLKDGAIPVSLNFPDLSKLANVTTTVNNNNRIMNVSIDAPVTISANNLTMDEVNAALVPKLEEQAKYVVQLIREVNEDDPRYLR